MAKPNAARTTLAYAELERATSQSTAEMLVQTMLIAPWDDIVTKDHLDARFAQVDARFAQVDARFAQVDARFAESDTKLERAMRNQTRWMIAAMFALNGALAALLTAVH